jgi:hypothetical protein
MDVREPHATPAATPATTTAKPNKRRVRPTLWPEVHKHQILMLESVYQRDFEDAQERWERVLKEMRLEAWNYIPARLVIDGGAWRDKTHPYAWVASVTKRKAKRLRLADTGLGGEQLPKIGDRSTEDTMDYLGQALSRRKGGVWKARRSEEDDYDPSPVSSVAREWLLLNREPGYDVNWDAIAQAAGLDDVEVEILQTRALGISRSALMAECRTETEWREYQAGWRRLSRKMPRVREVLSRENNFPKNVPDFEIPGTDALSGE